MNDQCIYCGTTSNVYNGRCEACAVIEFDNENAHGRSPWSGQQSAESLHWARVECEGCS